MLKKGIFVIFTVVCLLSSCASSRVSRIDEDKIVDLGAYWNENDVKIITDSLVNECVNAMAITNFIKENQRAPAIILGKFRNLSDEHLDTSIVAKKFEISLINSGKVDFLVSDKDREIVREERDSQQYYASEETAKGLGLEIGADFMLVGSVKTIVDQGNGQTLRSYIVNAELINIETNKKVWVGENSQIRKLIKHSSVRW